MKDQFAKTDRTTLNRLPKRGVFEREKVYNILDEGFVCHVGFVVDGRPFVIPTSYGRVQDNLFIHGSAMSRMLRTLSENVEVCITVTLIDGLVLARSAFHHSMNYRSAMIFGRASVVREAGQKLEALRAISEHIIPRRWDDVREPNGNELKATLVLRLPLIEASAKIRTGPPIDDEADYALPTWAGEVPLRLVAQTPVRDPRLPERIELPSYVGSYIRRKSISTAIEIRLANAKDSPLIASVLLSAFIEYRSSYSEAGFDATVLDKDRVEARMKEGPMWVASHNGVIVGTVAASSKNEALHVRSMAVLPAARGKKIGELLLHVVEDLAFSQAYKLLTLSTTPFLSRAIGLYERFGFKRSDEGPFDLFGTPLFSMVKELDLSDRCRRISPEE